MKSNRRKKGERRKKKEEEEISGVGLKSVGINFCFSVKSVGQFFADMGERKLGDLQIAALLIPSLFSFSFLELMNN